MAATFLTDIDLSNNTLERARLHNVGVDPTTSGTASQGLVLFRTDTKVAKLWNGAAFDLLTGGVVGVQGTAPSGTVQGVTCAGGPAGTNRTDQIFTISTTAATAGQAGSMSAADFTKLANATSGNTANTIVMRDGSGNFTAGVITAGLNGTASNASNLGSQAPSYYLDRTNHTGYQLASTISNFDTQVRTSRLDQMSAPTAAVSFNGQRVTGVADPTSGTDAVNRNYVDNVAAGIDIKASVRVATTANIALTGLQTVDGVSVAAGDRVLVKVQDDATTNGIYVVATGAWGRALDADSSAEVTAGMFTFIEEGATQSDTGWVLQTNNPITLGTTALAFTQFTGGAAYSAGNGLTQLGNSFSVVGTAGRISVSAAGVDIDANYSGQASITTVGIIGSGTWHGTAIGIANGGTGATTAAGARGALGAIGRAVGTITGDGGNTNFTFTHNLGNAAHSLTMTDSTGAVVYADFSLSTNADTIKTSTPIANGATYTLVAEG